MGAAQEGEGWGPPPCGPVTRQPAARLRRQQAGGDCTGGWQPGQQRTGVAVSDVCLLDGGALAGGVLQEHGALLHNGLQAPGAGRGQRMARSAAGGGARGAGQVHMGTRPGAAGRGRFKGPSAAARPPGPSPSSHLDLLARRGHQLLAVLDVGGKHLGAVDGVGELRGVVGGRLGVEGGSAGGRQRLRRQAGGSVSGCRFGLA